MRFIRHLFVLFLLSLLMLSMVPVTQTVPAPSIRSTMVSKVIGPELDEIRQHLQIVPEIRSHMNDLMAAVQDIRNLLKKVSTFDKKSFFSLVGS